MPDTETANAALSAVRPEETNEFIHFRDLAYRIPLHTVPTEHVAKFLLDHPLAGDKVEHVWAKEFLHHTPLHYARSKEIAELLTDLEPSDQYIMHPSWFKRTALHEARKLEVAQVLVSRTTEERRMELILAEDWVGDTAIHLAVNRGKYSIAKFLIRCLEEPVAENFITMLNEIKDRHIDLEDPYEKIANSKEDCLLIPDLGKNGLHQPGGYDGDNILRFFMFTQDVGLVVKFLQPFSPEEIRATVAHKNQAGLSCLQLAQIPASKLPSYYLKNKHKTPWSRLNQFLQSCESTPSSSGVMMKVITQLCNFYIPPTVGSVIKYTGCMNITGKRILTLGAQDKTMIKVSQHRHITR